jgi:hypothetical protein
MIAMTFASKNMQAIFMCGSNTVHGMEAQSRSSHPHAMHSTLQLHIMQYMVLYAHGLKEMTS